MFKKIIYLPLDANPFKTIIFFHNAGGYLPAFFRYKKMYYCFNLEQKNIITLKGEYIILLVRFFWLVHYSVSTFFCVYLKKIMYSFFEKN